jgi:hypothetical protein
MHKIGCPKIFGVEPKNVKFYTSASVCNFFLLNYCLNTYLLGVNQVLCMNILYKNITHWLQTKISANKHIFCSVLEAKLRKTES